MQLRCLLFRSFSLFYCFFFFSYRKNWSLMKISVTWELCRGQWKSLISYIFHSQRTVLWFLYWDSWEVAIKLASQKIQRLRCNPEIFEMRSITFGCLSICPIFIQVTSPYTIIESLCITPWLTVWTKPFDRTVYDFTKMNLVWRSKLRI